MEHGRERRIEPEPAYELSSAERVRVGFVLDFVELLAGLSGFDPRELRDPRNGRPLGPLVQRLQAALRDGDSPGA